MPDRFFLRQALHLARRLSLNHSSTCRAGLILDARTQLHLNHLYRILGLSVSQIIPLRKSRPDPPDCTPGAERGSKVEYFATGPRGKSNDLSHCPILWRRSVSLVATGPFDDWRVRGEHDLLYGWPPTWGPAGIRNSKCHCTLGTEMPERCRCERRKPPSAPSGRPSSENLPSQARNQTLRSLAGVESNSRAIPDAS